jgi:uncharacterized protein
MSTEGKGGKVAGDGQKHDGPAPALRHDSQIDDRSSLYLATVGTWLQILPQILRLVERAEAHCLENELPPEALLDARLAPDMWNFSKQVMYVILCSAGAVESLRSGTAGPDQTDPPMDFAVLRHKVAAAITLLKSVGPDEIENGADRDIVFAYTGNTMEYAGIDYLLSFCLPTFFFHASVAYAILRNQGLSIGKRHFIGRVRVKS